MTSEELSQAFGLMIKSRRHAIQMRQDELATIAGVSRKYLVELEAGKSTAWIGPALLIAKTLGIEFSPKTDAPADEIGDLPDMEM